EIMIIFAVKALTAILAVDGLLGADKAELEITERDTVVAMPAAQHGARHLARNAGDRRAAPDPARRRIADPGLAVAFVHVLDRHAADPVRQVMVLRGGDRGRQISQAELLKARQKTLKLLTAKNPE